MKKVIQILFIASFLVIIFGMGIKSLLEEDRETSDFENRTLAQVPPLEKESLLSGQYTKDFETYFSDQLTGRDEMIETFTRLQLYQNKGIINNIIVAENNWLFNMPYEPFIYDEIDQSLSKLRNFADSVQDVELFFAAVPNKMNMLKDLYPPFINSESGMGNLKYFMENLPKQIHGVSIYEKFKETYTQEELEAMYFKTDHHWNIVGAFTAYQEIIRELSTASALFEGEPLAQEELKLVCNKDAFFVGSNNLQLYNMIPTQGEKACFYEPYFDAENGTVTATPLWGGEKYTDIDQFYNTGFDKEEVRYSDIFSSDLPEIQFEYKNTGNDLHLLVLKDSYANPIQPFLAQHFNKTSILDIRHYHEKTIAKYVKDNDVDIVLFVYNDTNITDKAEMYENLVD